VGEAMHHRNLTVFPSFKGRDEPQRYVLLADAIEAGDAVVEEVDEGGQVPFLGVVNAGVTPILIPEGEILIGAKQNRTVNITVLVAAGVKFELPVSCVERGRWRYASRGFKAEGYAHPNLREKKLRSDQLNRRLAGVARSDQGEVWDEVGAHLAALAAPSPTDDVVEASRVSERRIEDYRTSIEVPLPSRRARRARRTFSFQYPAPFLPASASARLLPEPGRERPRRRSSGATRGWSGRSTWPGRRKESAASRPRGRR